MNEKTKPNTPAAKPAAPRAFAPCPPFLPPDVALSCTHVDEKGVTLRLWPKVEVVCGMLNVSYGPDGWVTRHYACGRALYCGLGVRMDNARGDGLFYRDAPCPSTYNLGADPAQREADGSFVAAAAMWGFGAGLLRMPDIFIPAGQVQVNPVAGPDGRTIRSYVLGERLTVDQIGYDVDGQVEAVQIVRATGGKVLWKRN